MSLTSIERDQVRLLSRRGVLGCTLDGDFELARKLYEKDPDQYRHIHESVKKEEADRMALRS